MTRDEEHDIVGEAEAILEKHQRTVNVFSMDSYFIARYLQLRADQRRESNEPDYEKDFELLGQRFSKAYLDGDSNGVVEVRLSLEQARIIKKDLEGQGGAGIDKNVLEPARSAFGHIWDQNFKVLE